MESPTSLLEWAGLAAVVIAGIFGAFNIFDRTMNTHRRRKDGIEKGLIEVMEKKIELQNKEIRKQNDTIGRLEMIITEVKAENDLLTQIIVKAIRKDSTAILKALEEAGAQRAASATPTPSDAPLPANPQ